MQFPLLRQGFKWLHGVLGTEQLIPVSDELLHCFGLSTDDVTSNVRVVEVITDISIAKIKTKY